MDESPTVFRRRLGCFAHTDRYGVQVSGCRDTIHRMPLDRRVCFAQGDRLTDWRWVKRE